MTTLCPSLMYFTSPLLFCLLLCPPYGVSEHPNMAIGIKRCAFNEVHANVYRLLPGTVLMCPRTPQHRQWALLPSSWTVIVSVCCRMVGVHVQTLLWPRGEHSSLYMQHSPMELWCTPTVWLMYRIWQQNFSHKSARILLTLVFASLLVFLPLYACIVLLLLSQQCRVHLHCEK